MIEFRVIGTEKELKRVAETLSSIYEVHYKSEFYNCKNSPIQFRQYFKVTEKECED